MDVRVLVFGMVMVASIEARRLISMNEIDNLFKRAFNHELFQNDTRALNEVFELLRRPEHVSTRSLESDSPIRMTINCLVCRSVFAALFESVLKGQTVEDSTDVITFFCVALGIEDYNVCRGAVALNMPILHHIILSTPEATQAAFCGMLVQNAYDKDTCPFNDPRFEWQVELPPSSGAQPAATTTRDHQTFTVAIITDAHIDPLYEAHGVADCNEPTCCRKGQKPRSTHKYKSIIDDSILENSIVKQNGEIFLDLDDAPKIREIRSGNMTKSDEKASQPAGYWGDYRNCDSPIWAFDDVIDRIADTHKNVDAVYYLGDSIDHGVWETTYELIDEMNRHVVEKIRSRFGDVPVVPVIGNHEAQPTNQFAPSSVTGDKLNTTWLYENLANKWSSYLDEEARATLRDRGDLSVLVRPGLRAISINNNVAYKDNWWLQYDPRDSKKHLDFLVEELHKAEMAGETVHILAHIPPGVHDLTYTWTREYNRIVNRFSSTIGAEFNGHTHSDEMKLFYDGAGAPVGVAWGAGAATAYTNYNLNYKIATFDAADRYKIINIENYVYNLTEANLTPQKRPHWFQLYDMKNSFQLGDLSAASIHDLTVKMVSTNKELLDLYAAFYSKISDTRWPNCSMDCKLDYLCKIVVTVLWERQRCDELVQIYKSN